MGNTIYHDLAAFGLPLVTPAQPGFASLVHDIESRPEPFGSRPFDDLSNAAVLLNETGNAILSISYSWRYTSVRGGTHSSRYCNLGTSSIQLDVLSGRSEVVRDFGTFILPGSKRLITERGMFGNNLDVLGQDPRPHGGGYVRSAGGGTRHTTSEKIVAVELILDLAILDDGRCVGPDESGLFESLIEDLERIRSSAEQATKALRDGASAGQIFEMLRPLARRPLDAATQRGRSPFLGMFAHMGIDQLVNSDSSAVASWLETQAQPCRLHLHRAS
jgi:hypothetical protein